MAAMPTIGLPYPVGARLVPQGPPQCDDAGVWWQDYLLILVDEPNDTDGTFQPRDEADTPHVVEGEPG